MKAENLPSYTLPSRRIMRPIVRVFSFARLLAEAGWEKTPVEDAKQALVDVLLGSLVRLSSEKAFVAQVQDATSVVIKSRRHAYGAAVAVEVPGEQIVELDALNLDAMYKDADRLLSG